MRDKSPNGIVILMVYVIVDARSLWSGAYIVTAPDDLKPQVFFTEMNLEQVENTLERVRNTPILSIFRLHPIHCFESPPARVWEVGGMGGDTSDTSAANKRLTEGKTGAPRPSHTPIPPHSHTILD